MDRTTYNTRVQVPAQTTDVVPLHSGIQQSTGAEGINEALILKLKGRRRVDARPGNSLLFSPKRIITIGTWNVRSLNATGVTALLTHELERLKWDVLGLAETHWTGVQESMIRGYKIISSGKSSEHRSGVAILLAKTAQNALMSYKPVSDRLLTARFRTSTGAVSIMQVYAPTADADDADMEEFYGTLQREINNSPKSDQLVVMGDFNAKVGTGQDADLAVMGKYGIGERNERGDRLVDFCFANNLFITNTKFKQTRESRTWTWESPDGRTHNQIDYILVQRRLVSSIHNSRAYPSADCGSDHQLVMANVKLKLKKNVAIRTTQRIDINKLKDTVTRDTFRAAIEEKWKKMLNEEVQDVNDEWVKVKSTIKDTSRDYVGFRKGQKPKEWMSEITLQLLNERRRYKALRRTQPDATRHHNYLCRAVKESAKGDKERFIQSICADVEKANSKNQTRAVYEGIRKITGRFAPQVRVIKSEAGTMLSEPSKVKERWMNYFDKLFNEANETDEGFLNSLPKSSNNEDIPELDIDEIRLAIHRMKKGKAPGIDDITAEELCESATDSGVKVVHRLCNTIWRKEKIPDEWKRSVIIPIHKKNDKLDCTNYRGISLLCSSGKVFSSIILQRIKRRTDESLSEAQAGFRAQRSTIDQIFTLRQLTEKYEEYSKELYTCYIDFRKAFDSVWRRGLWAVMRHYGYPEKIVRILETAYTDTFSAVRVSGELTGWFRTVVGVLQGCVLSPLLFNIFLEMIITMALDEDNFGACINGEIISNLRFADDIAVLAEDTVSLQKMINNVADVSQKMGMKINTSKTEIQYLGKGSKQMDLQLNGQSLTQTESFVYLGGLISGKDGTDADVTRRIAAARTTFQMLHKIWSSKELSKHTKLRVFETLVLSVLLYNTETWTLKVASTKRLQVFEMACLRRIEGVTRRDRLRNTEIKERLGWTRDIVSRIQTRRLRFFGHVTRMNGQRYPKIAMEGYVHGSRSRGRPKKRWIDMIREDCTELNVTVHEAGELARDRDKWRSIVKKLPLRAKASSRH